MFSKLQSFSNTISDPIFNHDPLSHVGQNLVPEVIAESSSFLSPTDPLRRKLWIVATVIRHYNVQLQNCSV